MMQEETNKAELWYEIINPGASLTQGDIILQCPLIGWKSGPLHFSGSGEDVVLKGATDCFTEDVVVMTQACDLEQNKVSNVVLCPCKPLTEFQQAWREERSRAGKGASPDAWKSLCKQIMNGFIWNLSMLNSFDSKELATEHRIVEFHEVFTVPRAFLESFLKQQGQARLRLRPPYREHLSQAFARFFMRVGLPASIEPVW